MNGRIAFKIHACEKHLENLRHTELMYENILTNKEELKLIRIDLEIEIDCLISQMVSVIDCILAQINIKLGLGIPLHQLSYDRIVSELSSKTKKIDLLTELSKARQHSNWYWSVVELKNRSLTTSFDINTPSPDLISFLEECFNHVRIN